jgi:hypothetical protein
MSHAATKNHETDHPATTAHKEPEKKAEKVKLEVLVALLATDVCHGDAHYRAQIQEMAVRLLKELGGGPEVKEPTAEQLQAQEAAGRLEGLPTGIRPAQDQPAMRQDERRQGAPTKEA